MRVMLLTQPRVGALLAAVCFASSASAQQADSARADSARARLVRHAPIVATASRLAMAPERVGFAFTTLTRADLAARRPATAADALREVSAAHVEEAVGPGGPTIVRLRGGEEVFTQVLLDGVVINENGGFIDLQGLTLSNVDRVEVVRGPQSALYGSSAVSGVVHLLSAVGVPGPLRAQVNAEGGGAARDGGNYRVNGNLSGGTTALRYAGGLGLSYERGYYALPHDTRSVDASVRIDGRASSKLELTATARFAGVDADHPVRDAGTTRAPLDPNARVERDRMIGSVRARLNSGSTLSHELGVTAYRQHFIYFDRFDDVARQQQFPFFVFDANLDFRSTLVRPTLEYVGRWRREQARVGAAWGGQLQREKLENRVNFDGNQSGTEFERDGGAVFGEVSYSPWSRLALLAGARAEKFGDLNSNVTPRASAVVTVTPQLAVRLAAGGAYKAPNLQDQYVDNVFIASNPDLKPETSASYEAGVDIRLWRGRVALGATAFTQRFENLIRTVQLNESMQINRNLGASRARGVEWELRLVPSPSWLIGWDGAAIRTRVLDNVGLSADNFPLNEELPFRPAVTTSAFVESAVVPRLTALLRARYVGEQTVLTERFSGERRTLDGFVVLGANLQYQLGARLDVYARADNLLDTDYDAAFDRPGAPARLSVGLEWRSR